ncbi:MAG: DUF3299 domain-containing protein [Gammaproteobacteria bacterium SHHR-1]|uniref:DUF3299 domain-containing protein n=1 Tax=Magnetovirga frankeli TaxID=947516 RepID=UPI001293A650|nr:DUF3299 domain-containing protein [gamma proteobacterium SS-5]
MKSKSLLLSLLLGLAVLAMAPLAPVLAESAAEPPAEELSWDALVPEDFNPEGLFEKYDLDQMEDNDPRAEEFMRELKAVWKIAPVVEELAGKRVKMPGFVVPLETQGDEVSSFFLVPYFGACIHVPPPPANQMVHVRLPQGAGLAADNLYEAVWVIGRLSIERTSNELGAAGYSMDDAQVEPYEED